METVSHIFIDDTGVARTVNHRVKVSMIGQKHVVAGESIQDIADHYDITLSDVHAALVYYYDHQEEFDQRREQNWQLIYEQGQSIDELLRESGHNDI